MSRARRAARLPVRPLGSARFTQHPIHKHHEDRTQDVLFVLPTHVRPRESRQVRPSSCDLDDRYVDSPSYGRRLRQHALTLAQLGAGSLPLGDTLSTYSAGLFARLDRLRQEMGRLLLQGRRAG
jgi:hypothetical protein